MISEEDLRRLKGWVKRHVARIRARAAEWNVQISSLVINVTLIAMIGLSITLIAMAISQVRLTVAQTPSGLTADLSHWVLTLAIDDAKLTELRAADRANLLGMLVSAFGAVVTAVFAVVAWMLSRAESNARSRNTPIATLPVYDSEGSDDVSVMMEEYSHAHSIVVFGGDFSWLREKNQDSSQIAKMRDLVRRLAESDKIRLISYKTDATVRQSIGDSLFDALQSAIGYNTRLNGLRASFIVNPFGRVLIYKVHADRHQMHICRVTDRTRDGKELLDQFGLLIATL